jgi:hypothetical protein
VKYKEKSEDGRKEGKKRTEPKKEKCRYNTYAYRFGKESCPSVFRICTRTFRMGRYCRSCQVHYILRNVSFQIFKYFYLIFPFVHDLLLFFSLIYGTANFLAIYFQLAW